MVYSCECGKLVKPLLNDVVKDLFCPECNTKLTSKSISGQVKLEQYMEVKNSESSEAIRYRIYNYLDRNNVVDATDSEMKSELGFTERSHIAPRRKELVDMGIVKESCKRMCNDSKKKITAWCIA